MRAISIQPEKADKKAYDSFLKTMYAFLQILFISWENMGLLIFFVKKFVFYVDILTVYCLKM